MLGHASWVKDVMNKYVRVQAWVPSNEDESSASTYEIKKDDKWEQRLAVVAESVAEGHYETCGEHFDSIDVCIRHENEVYNMKVNVEILSVVDFNAELMKDN